MTAPINSDIYTKRMDGRQGAPRRFLHGAENTSTLQQMHSGSGTRISDLIANEEFTPVSNPIRATPNRNQPTDAPPPMPAGQYYASDLSKRIDPKHRGIRIFSNASRTHHMTPEYMNRMGRVIERSEIDPYTGKRIDYYRKPPPEANADYRLPEETMQHVNRRLIALTGYDPTEVKQARREKRKEIPGPDGSRDQVANYMRTMNEIEKRIRRTAELNRDGERPAWTREKKAFGHVGYHNMVRHIPYVPETMRADTKPLKPTPSNTDLVHPQNKVIQGLHRSNARRPHVEKVDLRTPAEAPYNAAPLRGEIKATHRRKGENIRDQRMYHSSAMSGSGASSDTMTRSIISKHYERRGKHQQAGAIVTGHTGPASTSVSDGSRLPKIMINPRARREGVKSGAFTLASARTNVIAMPNISAESQLIPNKREGVSGGVWTHASEYVGVNAGAHISGTNEHMTPKRADSMGLGNDHNRTGVSAIPNISHDITHKIPNRTDVQGPVMSGLALSMMPSVSAHAMISKESDLPNTKREDGRVDDREYFAQANASHVGNHALFEASHQEKNRRQGHLFNSESAQLIKGRAQAEGVGATQFGYDTTLDRVGKRAFTGAVSATQFLHGGGVGSVQRDGMTRNMAAYDTGVDKTTINLYHRRR